MITRTTRWISKISFIALCALLTACYSETSSHSSTPKTEIDIAVEDIVNNTITPALDNFSNETASLQLLIQDFCAASSATRTESNILALQEQWITTNSAWFKLSPYLLGPLSSKDSLTAEAFWYIDSFRQRGNPSTNTIRSDISTSLSASTEINAESFSGKRFNLVGLLALEVLLFETSDTQSKAITDILTEYQNTPRKCEILAGQANELNRRVTIIHNAWHKDYRSTGVGYRDLLVNKKLESTFTANNDIDGTGTPAFTRLVVSVQAHLDFLNKRSITTSAAQLSMSIWPALNHTYDSLHEFLDGTNTSRLSLYQMMENGYDANIITLKDNMAFFKLSIEEKNTVNFKNFAAALDGNFKRELPQALNAELGLTFTDGD